MFWSIMGLMANLDEIKKIAESIRSNLDQFVENNKSDFFYHKDLSGACGIASAVLFNELKNRELKAKLMWGSNNVGLEHCWVETEKYLIDITYTQFDNKANKIFIIDKISENEKYLDYVFKWDEQKSILDIEKDLGWGEYSRPSFYRKILDFNQSVKI